MAVDWLATVQEHGEIVQRMAATVPEVLSDPDLTFDQASLLYRDVEQGAQDFDKILEHMGEVDVDEALVEAAEALETIWARLSVATANRVRTMRGLDPIEFAEDKSKD